MSYNEKNFKQKSITKVQLWIGDVMLEERTVVYPPRLLLGIYEHYVIRKNTIDSYILEIKSEHIRAIVKYPDYKVEIVYTTPE